MEFSRKSRPPMKNITGAPISRRALLAGSAAQTILNAQSPSIPIIDTHVHFFDTTRPQGVPYPGPNVIPGFPIANPEKLREVVVPLGVVGAIEVEASPWVEDNLWVLEMAPKDPFIVGDCGKLSPGRPRVCGYCGR